MSGVNGGIGLREQASVLTFLSGQKTDLPYPENLNILSLSDGTIIFCLFLRPSFLYTSPWATRGFLMLNNLIEYALFPLPVEER